MLFPVFASFAATAEHAVFKSRNRGHSWFRTDTGMPHESRIEGFRCERESSSPALSLAVGRPLTQDNQQPDLST